MSGRINLKRLVAICVLVTAVHTDAVEAAWEDVIFYDDAVVGSGESYASVTVYDSPPETATIEFYGEGEYLTMYDSSTMNLREGANFVNWDGYGNRLYDSSALSVYEGAKIGAGSGALMNVHDLSTLNIYGGMVDLLLWTDDSSTLNVFRGTLGSVIGFGGGSIINVYAGYVSGWIGNIQVEPTATVNIYGYGFEYDPHGRWMLPIPGDGGEGRWVSKLTGYGFEGDPIAVWGLPDPDTHENVNLIPEPVTIALLGLGGLVEVRRR